VPRAMMSCSRLGVPRFWFSCACSTVQYSTVNCVCHVHPHYLYYTIHLQNKYVTKEQDIDLHEATTLQYLFPRCPKKSRENYFHKYFLCTRVTFSTMIGGPFIGVTIVMKILNCIHQLLG